MTLDQSGIQKYLGRCDEAIHSAETLSAEGLYPEAISRAWYAVIHAVIMLVSSIDREVRQPDQAEKLFSQEYVQAMSLPPELWPLFEQVSRSKRAAARNDLIRYSQDSAESALEQARTFLQLASSFLASRKP